MDKDIIWTREGIVASGMPLELIGYIHTKYDMINDRDIYHYTDVNGFISIIQNRELWLSHIRFLNDRKEYLEGIEICKKIIEELKSKDNIRHTEFLNSICSTNL